LSKFQTLTKVFFALSELPPALAGGFFMCESKKALAEIICF